MTSAGKLLQRRIILFFEGLTIRRIKHDGLLMFPVTLNMYVDSTYSSCSCYITNNEETRWEALRDRFTPGMQIGGLIIGI